MIHVRRWWLVAAGTVAAVYACLWALRFVALFAELGMVLALVGVVVAGVRRFRSAKRSDAVVPTRGRGTSP